jgi:hypothetical protein
VPGAQRTARQMGFAVDRYTKNAASTCGVNGIRGNRRNNL